MKMIYSKMKALYSFQSLWFVLIFICIFFYLGMHNELFFAQKAFTFLDKLMDYHLHLNISTIILTFLILNFITLKITMQGLHVNFP